MMGKLREKMKADLELKGFSPMPRNYYLRHAGDFAKHFNRSPAQMGEEEVRSFLLHFVKDRKVSAGYQSNCLSALKFLYSYTLKRPEVVAHVPQPKKPRTLPVVLSKQEVSHTSIKPPSQPLKPTSHTHPSHHDKTTIFNTPSPN